MSEYNLKFVKFIRSYLKNKIINSTDGFQNHENERQQIYDLLKRTVEKGESNSALIIGPQGSGKTTLIRDVLKSLETETELKGNAIVVHLNGLLHTDDNSALKSIALQMNISEVTERKVAGTFAENLAFLLTCLRSGERETSKCLIFILEEFDLFCNHSNQTLLYNLLDMTHNSPVPICVIGLTCRLDVTELFEKRVKSRFSHRQIFIFPGNGSDNIPGLELQKTRFKDLLSFTDKLSKDESKKFGAHIKDWNKYIGKMLKEKKVESIIESLYDLTVDERDLKNFLICVISRLEDIEDVEQRLVIKDKLTEQDFVEEFNYFMKDPKVLILENLSVLEICLLIAMKHHCEIYDDSPFNFEMIYARYNKFAKTNAITQATQKPIVLKAFEHLVSLELISPFGGYSRHQKEYQLYKLLFLPKQFNEAFKNCHNMPTEIIQWAGSSVV